MRTGFTAGFFTTTTDAASTAGDWRLAGWATRVVQWPEVLGSHPRREVLDQVGRVFGVESVATPDDLAAVLASVPASTVLIWARGQAFAEEFPAVWRDIADVLQARVAAQPAFAVVLAGADKRSKERDRWGGRSA